MNAQEFARNWIDDWNTHDMDKILSHYSDEIEITTPMIKMALGQEQGTLKGKTAVAGYWQSALAKFPDLHFELIEVTESINSVAIYYKSVMDRRAIEVMFFDEQDRVSKMIAFYTA